MNYMFGDEVAIEISLQFTHALHKQKKKIILLLVYIYAVIVVQRDKFRDQLHDLANTSLYKLQTCNSVSYSLNNLKHHSN